MKAKLGAAYERLQTLDITPTLSNMEKLIQSLYDLKDIFNELEKEGAGDGRSETDPDGRDDP